MEANHQMLVEKSFFFFKETGCAQGFPGYIIHLNWYLTPIIFSQDFDVSDRNGFNHVFLRPNSFFFFFWGKKLRPNRLISLIYTYKVFSIW